VRSVELTARNLRRHTSMPSRTPYKWGLSEIDLITTLLLRFSMRLKRASATGEPQMCKSALGKGADTPQNTLPSKGFLFLSFNCRPFSLPMYPLKKHSSIASFSSCSSSSKLDLLQTQRLETQRRKVYLVGLDRTHRQTTEGP
jgi:hypothetical protein